MERDSMLTWKGEYITKSCSVAAFALEISIKITTQSTVHSTPTQRIQWCVFLRTFGKSKKLLLTRSFLIFLFLEAK